MPNPPKPTELKALQGTARKDRANPAEPKLKASTSVPAPPDWLDDVGREFFERIGRLLVDMKVMTGADWDAWAQVADAYSEYRAARKVLRKRGLTYRTVTNTGAIMHRRRPEQAVSAETWKRVQAGLSAFGLTPSSRAKIQALGDGAVDDFGAFLGRRQGA